MHFDCTYLFLLGYDPPDQSLFRNRACTQPTYNQTGIEKAPSFPHARLPVTTHYGANETPEQNDVIAVDVRVPVRRLLGSFTS